MGYDVTCEDAGRKYRVQTPQDPGPTLRVQVSPLVPPMQSAPPSGLTPVPAPAPMVLPARPISAAPAQVVVASYQATSPAAYPVMAPPPPPAHGWHRRHPGDWR